MAVIETKECSKCGEIKTIEQFSKNRSKKDGLQIECKTCRRKYMRKYNKTESAQQSKERYANTPKYRETRRKVASEYESKYQGVYGIFCKGKCLYIGATSAFIRRANDHWYRARVKSDIHPSLYYTLNDYVEDGMVIGLIYEGNDFRKKENYYINKFNPLLNARG